MVYTLELKSTTCEVMQFIFSLEQNPTKVTLNWTLKVSRDS
jgi:hypothetical protein